MWYVNVKRMYNHRMYLYSRHPPRPFPHPHPFPCPYSISLVVVLKFALYYLCLQEKCVENEKVAEECAVMYIQLEQVHHQLVADGWVSPAGAEKVSDTSDGVLRAVLSRSLSLHQVCALTLTRSHT